MISKQEDSTNISNVSQAYWKKFVKLSNNANLRFVFKKFIFYLVILFFALSLVWFIPRLSPINPLDAIAVSSGSGSWVTARKAELTKFYGLDQPLWDQYLTFWWNLIHLNLGFTFDVTPSPLIDTIFPSFILTMILVIPVLILGFIIGNYIGSKAAINKGKGTKLTYYLGVFFQSAPYYWTALGLMIIFFYIQFELNKTIIPKDLPHITDFHYDISHPINFLKMYSIPFFIMLLFSTGGWSTGMRAMMVYELDSPYLLYAKQLGSKKSLIESYARRNAILPQVTGLNLRFNELVGATLIVEYVFTYPGLGTLIVRSAQNYNYPLIIGSFIIIILAIVIGNFILDITYGLLDPRIRTGKRS